MTRTYALKRLLEHGPLTKQEIFEIMGGNKRTLSAIINELIKQKTLRRYMPEGKCRDASRVYMLSV